MKEKLFLKLFPVAVGIVGSVVIGYVVKGERQVIKMVEDRFSKATDIIES
jgi:hypothetical protein